MIDGVVITFSDISSLLLEEDLSTEQRDYIESIRSGGEALLSVINDILEFSHAFFLRANVWL